MHHGFIAHGYHLHDVRELLSQSHGPFYFRLVGLEILGVVVGAIRPGTRTIYPCPEHDVHLKLRVFCLQSVNGLDHISRVGQLHVVGPYHADAHGVKDAQILFQLIEGRLLSAAEAPISSVANGWVLGVSQKFGCRFVLHGVVLVCGPA